MAKPDSGHAPTLPTSWPDGEGNGRTTDVPRAGAALSRGAFAPMDPLPLTHAPGRKAQCPHPEGCLHPDGNPEHHRLLRANHEALLRRALHRQPSLSLGETLVNEPAHASGDFGATPSP